MPGVDIRLQYNSGKKEVDPLQVYVALTRFKDASLTVNALLNKKDSNDTSFVHMIDSIVLTINDANIKGLSVLSAQIFFKSGAFLHINQI